jgi:hypothetical protein
MQRWRVAAEGTERHAVIIRDLEIPVPFDLGLFVAWLERRRGRGIRLCPFRSGAGMPCGFWIGTAEADLIYYERATSAFHQTHIVMHEIAHMLLGHRGRAPAWQGVARVFAPDLDPALIRLILGRGTYSAREEEEAETLASFILQRPGNLVGSTPAAGYEDARVLGRLQQVWGRGNRQAA